MRGPPRGGNPILGLRRAGIPILFLATFAPAEAQPQTRELPPSVTVGKPDVLAPPPEGLPLYIPIPEDNTLTHEKIALGRRLFFDPILSADRSVRCASCHRPDHGFADTVALSHGALGRRPERNSPSLLNAGYGGPFFWDGRTASLEEQVLQPISNAAEMALPIAEAVNRLAADSAYRGAFRKAFGHDQVDSTVVARALASYVRTLRAADSPADRFAAGDIDALSEAARRGYALFVGKAGCAACHGGPFFTDERLHNTGVGWGGEDTGRAQVTGRPEDRGMFNTPSLRNVAETSPYMHDGSIVTLRDAVEFYDRGAVPNPNLDRRLKPLGLSEQEIVDLVAFLESLGGRLEALGPDGRPVPSRGQ